MKTLNELFNNFRDDCNAVSAIAYDVKDEINSLKLDDVSHKELLTFMGDTSNSLKRIPERISIACKLFCVLERHLRESKIDFDKKFDDERIVKLIDEDWERAERVCEENRKLYAKKLNKT